MTIRILIADDHAIVRNGIKALLAAETDLVVVGEAKNGEEAVAAARAHCPDVILMDLLMPHLDGIEAIRRILAEQPAIKIMVLSSFATDDKVFQAINAGAVGYLLKDSSLEDLVEAIRRVQRGEPALHPAVARKILAQLRQPPGKNRPPEPLTDRETEVLKLVAGGRSNREIAAALVISEATVRTHVSSILAKLHLDSRTQAALHALRSGLARLEEEAGAYDK